MQLENITLYYREGSSDKVYQASIQQAGERYVVNFAYGRRGSTLNTGTKTNVPVDFAQAKRTYDKLVREKMGKGYTAGEAGTPYQHTDKAVSGILPQLLNPIGEEEIKTLLTDEKHCAQEKYDGRRVLIRKQGTNIIGINKKGLVVGLAQTLIEVARVIPGNFVLDGESLGDRYYAFDLLEVNDEDQRAKPYKDRLVALMNVMFKGQQRFIGLTFTAFTPLQKSVLIQELHDGHKEGIVFKRLDAPYTPGRPNSGGAQLKHKFVSTLSAVVSKINARRSVELRLLNGKGWIPCGNVTIPVNFKIPKVGEVVEIRYLYAFPESKVLYQPVFLGPRTDVEQHECVVSQLKFKPEEDEC